MRNKCWIQLKQGFTQSYNMTNRRQIIENIIKERPNDAVLVANKYKVIAGVIRRMFPEIKEITELEPVIVNGKSVKDKLVDIIFEAVNADRDWRLATEGQDKENKERLEVEYLKENGYISPKLTQAQVDNMFDEL